MKKNTTYNNTATMCFRDCVRYSSCEDRDPIGDREQCTFATHQGEKVYCSDPNYRHDCYDNIIAGKCSACNEDAASKGQLLAELVALNDAQVIAKRDLMRAEQAKQRAELEQHPDFDRYQAFDLKTGQPVERRRSFVATRAKNASHIHDSQ